MLTYAALTLAIVALASIASAQTPSGTLLQRPNLRAQPHGPTRQFPPSPPRTKTCRVEQGTVSGADDGPRILKAFQDCNNGGLVQLDAKYTIVSPLDLTFLSHVDVALVGTVTFGGSVDYWITHTFKYGYQNASGESLTALTSQPTES